LDVALSLQRTGLVQALDRPSPHLKDALFKANFEKLIEPALDRANRFRTDPSNAAWLENGAEGPPPRIWTRDARGDWVFGANPARESVTGGQGGR
jgi:hypothetical protein